MTSESDRRRLLALARDAIVAHVTRRPKPDAGRDAIAARCGGAFVSLHHQEDLRGCIGHVEANEPLGSVIPRCAVAACSADPRFPPVSPGELSDLTIELSLLGSLEPLDDPAVIEIGRHGLLIENGRARGLLLPQVAVEWQWDRETFLTQTCRKAGLPADGWKKGAALWRFEAEVFRE
jgi:AmmeMemoRadiSam system protein A